MALVEGAPFLPHSFISNFTRTYIQPTCHFACFLLPCLSALVWAIVHTITSFLYKKDGTCALPTKISNCLPTRISQIIKIGRKNIHPTRHHIFIHTGIALFKDLSVFAKCVAISHLCYWCTPCLKSSSSTCSFWSMRRGWVIDAATRNSPAQPNWNLPLLQTLFTHRQLQPVFLKVWSDSWGSGEILRWEGFKKVSLCWATKSLTSQMHRQFSAFFQQRRCSIGCVRTPL